MSHANAVADRAEAKPGVDKSVDKNANAAKEAGKVSGKSGSGVAAAALVGRGDEARFDALFEAMSAEERKDMFDGIGKDLARVAGAEALATMLRDSGLSGREIDARFGYDHAALSRTANGKSVSGPTLWRLYALAEALGFDIELKVTART